MAIRSARLAKSQKELLKTDPCLKTDPFFCYGRVHPSEYDWKSQFSQVAVDTMKNPSLIFRPFDVGKVLGLAAYAVELEETPLAASEQRNRKLEAQLEIARKALESAACAFSLVDSSTRTIGTDYGIPKVARLAQEEESKCRAAIDAARADGKKEG